MYAGPVKSDLATLAPVLLSAKRNRSDLRRAVHLGILVTAVALCFPGVVATYSFRVAIDDPDGVPLVARRWSRDAWGPGRTLTWHIGVGRPDWDKSWWGSPTELTPIAEEALSVWSQVPTADILWNLEGTAQTDRYQNTVPNLVSVEVTPDGSHYAFAQTFEDRNASGQWEVTSCEVTLLNPNRSPPDEVRELDQEERTRWVLPFLVHELGHCLGLGHSQTFPGNPSYYDAEEGWFRWAPEELWDRPDPVMAYGATNVASLLTADDRAGASLLRPASGWVAKTGSVSGRLLHDGQPVAMAYVWAFGNTDRIRDGIGAFTDYDGNFQVAGLAPGNYTLWISPLTETAAQPRLFEEGSLENVYFDLDETVLPHPVRVEAERVTEAGEIAVRRARHCTPPLRCRGPS